MFCRTKSACQQTAQRVTLGGRDRVIQNRKHSQRVPVTVNAWLRETEKSVATDDSHVLHRKHPHSLEWHNCTITEISPSTLRKALVVVTKHNATMTVATAGLLEPLSALGYNSIVQNAKVEGPRHFRSPHTVVSPQQHLPVIEGLDFEDGIIPHHPPPLGTIPQLKLTREEVVRCTYTVELSSVKCMHCTHLRETAWDKGSHAPCWIIPQSVTMSDEQT